MSRDLVKITFLPDGETLDVMIGTRLLKVILDAGRPIGYSCRGQGVCTACVLRVVGHASPIGPPEQALLDRLGPTPSDGEGVLRIGCFVRVLGDSSVRADYW
jgi:ferredoxin